MPGIIALALIAIVAVLLFSFLFVPALEICTDSNASAFSQMPSPEVAIPLESDKVFKQNIEVFSDAPVDAINLIFGTYDRVNQGMMSIKLYENDTEVAAWITMTGTLLNTDVTKFPLTKPLTPKKDSVYTLIISESCRGDNIVALWTNSERTDGYYLDDEYVPTGSVCYSIEYGQHSYRSGFLTLLPFMAVLVALAILIVAKIAGVLAHLTPVVAFCLVCIIGLLATLTVFNLAVTDVWPMYFFKGESDYFKYADTGMDFYHSIEYLHGNDPYGIFGTIYPPLANLMFKAAYHLVPQAQKNAWQDDYMDSAYLRRTENDLRVWMPTAMTFLLFFIAVSLAIYICIAHYDDKRKHSLLAVLLLFNYGFLYALERGNIIILSMATALFFVLNWDSPSHATRELALLSLAVSANLKVYPAIFGIILLYNKRWKEAVRAVIYGVAMFVLPCLFFENGLQNILFCMKNVLGFSGRLYPNNLGTGFDKLLFSLFTLANRYLGTAMPSSLYFERGPIIDRTLLLLSLACGVILPKKWQKCMCCTLGILLFSNPGIYGAIFVLLPAVMFFREETAFSPRNIAPFAGIAMCLACLPVFNSYGDGFSFISFRLQVGLLILLVYMIVETVRVLLEKRAGA